MKRFAVFVLLLGTLLGAGSARAVEPDEMLADPALEARARQISKQLRCVVCQNESIDESHAELARDLRLLVRERLTQGDADDDILSYVSGRYGDYVLLSPPFKATTWALWLLPFAFVLAASVAVRHAFRHSGFQDPPSLPLTEEERRRLSELIQEDNAAPKEKP